MHVQLIHRAPLRGDKWLQQQLVAGSEAAPGHTKPIISYGDGVRQILRYGDGGRRKRVRVKASAGMQAKDQEYVVRVAGTSNGGSNISNRSTAVPQVLRGVRGRELMDIQRLVQEASRGGRSFWETACNVADLLIGGLLAPGSLGPGADPAVQLAGNCAPVPETPPSACAFDAGGALPDGLRGVYVRNGPNAARLFDREGYHMFDGDGMLHAVTLSGPSRASYCCRHVRTSRFVQEELAGRPLFLKIFGGARGTLGFARAALVLARALLGVLNMRDGWGLSNTSACFFNGQLLSLSEDDMPYAVHVAADGDLVTLGRLKFASGPCGAKARSTNMCAHPKFDPRTGEMFAFHFRPSPAAPFSFFKVSPSGVKSRDVHIPLRDISFIHDFAITEHYTIFPDNQFVIRPLQFLRGQMPVVCDEKKTPMFCLVPRSAATYQQTTKKNNNQEHAYAPLWFEAPGLNGYHFINAWEEQDEVVIITPNISPPERFLEIPAKSVTCMLTEVRLNLTTGKTSMRQLCPGSNLEFGTFNHNYTGRKIRYVYLASGSYPELRGVVKVDLQQQDRPSCIVATKEFGPHCHVSEPFFVPRLDNSNHQTKGPGCSHKEDDGYLLCLVHNINTGVCKLLVMDAQSPSLDIIASIKLPSRVPYGFHGCFIHEHQLAKQSLN